MHRLHRRRVCLNGLYGAGRTPLTDPGEVGAALRRHWGDVFRRRPMDAWLAAMFLDHVQAAGPIPEWGPSCEHLVAVATVPHESAPGMDGVGYSFRREAGDDFIDMLSQVAYRMRAGVPPPPGFLASGAVFIPKAEVQEDGDLLLGEVGETRMLSLMTSGAKLLALSMCHSLSPVASRILDGRQRGFVAGRQMGQNLLVIDAAAVEASMCCPDSAILLLDFANAFPSLGHEFLMAVLGLMDLPPGLLAA